MPARRPSVATIGAYDGVHHGHRQVIETVRQIADAEELASVVVTFDRHPATVVRPESAPKLLTDLHQKLELLEATGVDDVVVLRFDEERANQTAEEFVDEVLVGLLGVAVVVVGRDSHFGKGRGGNVALLDVMGEERGFRVVPFDLVEGEGEVVSSTRIRTLVAAGRLGEAAALLGRDFEVRGRIDGRAVTGPEEILRPAAGSYRVTVAPVGTDDGPSLDAAVKRAAEPLVLSGDPGFEAGTLVRVCFERPARGS
ncbi:MAG: adenylyltransferase/cytidyltransferase family protein [Acidimicrobiales bacterium]